MRDQGSWCRLRTVRSLALLLCLLPATSLAQAPPILQALRQQAWPVAEALAAATNDPLAAKLVDFIRLLNPGQAGAAELQRFMAENPGWPDQDMLERRYGEALVDEPDERTVAALCSRRPPNAGPALLRCAEASALAGRATDAVRLARLGWVALPSLKLAEDELARWGGVLTQADQRQRFERLESSDPEGARRQLNRLDPPFRLIGAARLALRRRDPDALTTLDAVPPSSRGDPPLLLAEARYLRRSNATAAALALWRTALPPAEDATPVDRRAPFWAERDALARQFLANGDADSAYQLANDTALPPDQAIEADFLSGWIALRRLHNPAQASRHFQALAEGSHSAITEARAFYWLARAQTDPTAAKLALDRATAWPTTYYGQLAAREAGLTEETVQARIAALPEPGDARTREQVAGTELARAASLLVAWSDPRRAADFLRQLIQPPATDTCRAAVAHLALGLGLPDVAVQAARLAGRDGVIIPQAGWPTPVQPPSGVVPAALALGLMRQESSFDPTVVSAAGAHGLMQLMPATATQMGHALHVASSPLSDPAVNMHLGTAYLAGLLAQFGGVQPYAIAAYNAGARHVHDWISANGDAAAGDADAMVDWIELIPFAETRNYVQRVLENEAIYRGRTQGAG
jgi:soluble lytic murein transglycosylase